jgi:hypothetical protein
MMTTEMMTNELITAVEAMDPEILGGAVLGIFAIFAISVIITVIRYLLQAIGYSKMYRKAGVDPWKAFIPVYNTYNNYKLSWNREMFTLSVALYIVLNSLGGAETLIPQLAAAATGITLIVVMVKQNIKMAKLFGKGKGTGIALMFFPGITSLILGLGKAEYQGILQENN